MSLFLEDLTIIKALNNTLMKGPLPENIDSKKLVKLEIDNSGLTGRLPKDLEDLTSMQVLFLENNSLTDTIPDLDDTRKLVASCLRTLQSTRRLIVNKSLPLQIKIIVELTINCNSSKAGNILPYVWISARRCECLG